MTWRLPCLMSRALKDPKAALQLLYTALWHGSKHKSERAMLTAEVREHQRMWMAHLSAQPPLRVAQHAQAGRSHRAGPRRRRLRLGLPLPVSEVAGAMQGPMNGVCQVWRWQRG